MDGQLAGQLFHGSAVTSVPAGPLLACPPEEQEHMSTLGCRQLTAKGGISPPTGGQIDSMWHVHTLNVTQPNKE